MQQKDNKESPNVSFQVRFEEGNLIIESNKGHQLTLIWLIGLNNHPQRFLNFFLSAPISETLFKKGYRVIVPCSPQRKVTIYDNKVCPAWFDVRERSDKSFKIPVDQAFNVENIEDSYNLINVIIEDELKRLNGDEKKLYLGGFSQGCTMALYVGFKKRIQWGGIVCAAGYMFDHTPFNQNDLNIRYRIFHGNNDQVRPLEIVKESYNKFGLGDKLIIIDKMGHDFKRSELKESISEFLAQ